MKIVWVENDDGELDGEAGSYSCHVGMTVFCFYYWCFSQDKETGIGVFGRNYKSKSSAKRACQRALDRWTR